MAPPTNASGHDACWLHEQIADGASVINSSNEHTASSDAELCTLPRSHADSDANENDIDNDSYACHEQRYTHSSPVVAPLSPSQSLSDKLALLRPSATPLARTTEPAQCTSANRTTTTTSNAKVSFVPVTKQNVQQLRHLNIEIFPVRYNDAFYDDILHTPQHYSTLAYVNRCVVGAICCRLEPPGHTASQQQQQLRTYIMTLGVLASHRQCRIGSQLLTSVIDQSMRDGVAFIYLHVQTTNVVALQFYEAFGFVVVQTLKDYYKRIDPPDCYILRKALTRKKAEAAALSASEE